MRTWMVIAAVALTAGCGGGSGQKAAPTTASAPAASTPPSPSPPAPSSPAPAAPSGSPTVVLNGVHPGREPASTLDGKWQATTAGVRVALYLYRGAAALNSPHFCAGTIDAAKTIKLTCSDHDIERTSGQAVLKGAKLTVTWATGRIDTLARTPR